MGGVNWVDVIILIIIVYAVYFGVRIGFFKLLFLFVGFFLGLSLGGWIFPRLLPIHNQTVKSVINANLVFALSAILAVKGFSWGEQIHFSLKGRGRLWMLESAAGVVLSLASTLIAIWLAAAAVGVLPFAGFSNTVNDSAVVQAMDSQLPSVPSALSVIDKVVNPNSPPRIYVKQLPNSSIGELALPPANQSVIGDSSSIVRVTSFGCQGIVGGSGFVVSQNLVATAAHVIAGVKHPVIKYKNQSLAAVPVLFNSNMDFALLRVNDLKAPALDLSSNDVKPGAQVYSLSYPSGVFAIVPGQIAQNAWVAGPNIYGLGSIYRHVYGIITDVKAGSSGGAVVTDDGRLVGLIFASAQNSNNYGYAQAITALTDDINQAQSNFQRVGTGVCVE